MAIQVQLFWPHGIAMPDPSPPADETLHTPERERVATTNAWAFLHWLRIGRGRDLAGWSQLQHYSAADPAGFSEAVASFAGLPDEPLPLARHAGPREALILRRADGSRRLLSRDALLSCRTGLPDEIAALLARRWPKPLLVRPLAALLLHADLRPDDRVLVGGESAWPWLAALTQGATVILAPSAPLLAAAAEEAATVIVAPAAALAEAAHRRPGHRPDLTPLRLILATGGPLAPQARIRVYTWIKSDVMLLARSGDTVWGNPLEPVAVRPKPGPALFVLSPAMRLRSLQPAPRPARR